MATNLNAIIIDDEFDARAVLEILLSEFCPQVSVVAKCESLTEGIDQIKTHKPDVIFLDIQMPGMAGVEINRFFELSEKAFDIVFTTAYEKYALQAFRLSATDYLLKPIQPSHLVEAVQKVSAHYQRKKNNTTTSPNHNQAPNTTLQVPTLEQSHIIQLSQLVVISASGAYSELLVANAKKPILASKHLKFFEDALLRYNWFARVHRSYILNLNYLEGIKKGRPPKAVFYKGRQIPVSHHWLKNFEQQA